MKLSIIIPCYNEVETVLAIINKINDEVKFNKEIIIIDDFSTDGTREILKDINDNRITKLILNEKNYGKGYCIRRGLQFISGNFVIIQDADLEYDPSEY